MSESVDPASEFDCATLMQRPNGARVILWKQASADFGSLDLRQKAQLLAYMELWVDDRRMNDKQYNPNEGRVKSTNRMLQAFKIHKVRGYGIVCSLGGRKTFIVVAWDTSKKDDKAKKRILDVAKDRAGNFERIYGK